MYTHLRCAYGGKREPTGAERAARGRTEGKEGVGGAGDAEGAPRTAGGKRGGSERRKKDEGRRKGSVETGKIGDLDAEKHGGTRRVQ